MACGSRCKTPNFEEIRQFLSKLSADMNVHPVRNQALNVPGPSRILTNVPNSKKDDKPKRTRRKPRIQKNVIVDNTSGTNSPSTIMSPLINHRVPSQLFTPTSDKPQQAPVPRKTRYVKSTGPRQTDSDEAEEFSFIIKPKPNQSDGKFVRRRTSKSECIKLRSFVKNVDSKNCVFTTNLSAVENLVQKFSKMNLSKEKESPKSKSESRKLTPKEAKRKKKHKKSEREYDETPFPDYLTDDEVTLGLANGTLIKGVVRINPRKSSDSYVSNEDTSKADYYLTSVSDRNRALEGDEVVLQLKPESEWVEGNKTARVVYISQKIHPRTIIGILKPANSKNSDFALFYPRDTRCPLVRIPEVYWPNGFKNKPKVFEEILFVAKIIFWTVPAYATGTLIENLGLSGDIEVETISILKEYCLNTSPFGEEMTKYLPQSSELPKEEFERREDLRQECIFTIDPATARDLDDAVSVKTLPNGNYEIGVHISDVSYYVEEGNELDQLVAKKATSVYMVNSVYHMLPEELCLHCSLLPGVDKLAFSVFWEMTKEGDVVGKRFTRSIVNSCAKLAYEHAQMIIENPDRNFTAADFPKLHNNFEPKDLVDTVNILQSIAVKLRNKRIENGAIKIDQVKLLFSLDPTSGQPLEYFKYENKESHRLIEEFMLLANISVAEKIYESFPDTAFLRCHEPPKQTMLVELQNSLAAYGIHLDISSSSNIRTSLEKYLTDDYTGLCRQAVLNHLIAKAMTRAKYFCSSCTESESDFKHYALSVPIYTHFTSPIRRYADVMVHRLLAASLNYRESPEWDQQYVSAIAINCNLQKYNAKRAGEASCELYLCNFIDGQKPYEQDCVVVDVKERSFDVIVLKTGSIVRIYPNNCEQGTQWKSESVMNQENSPDKGGKSTNKPGKKQLRLTITFPKTKSLPQTKMVVEIFSIVKVNLQKKEKSYKLEGTLLRPLQQQIFNRRDQQ